jgi:hypothetical protein
MQSLSYLHEVELIGFWLSFTVIGAAAFICLYNFARSRNNLYVKYLRDLQPITILFISTCFGILAMGLSFIPGYLFHLNMAILIWYYFLLLILSLAIIISNYKKLLYKLSASLKSRDGIYYVLLCIAVIALAVNASLAWHIGESVQYDSALHMARVNSVSNGHMSLLDPFFGYNGVYDLRYSINVTSTILGLGSRILGINAITIWAHSYAWFTTMLCFGVASLCEFFLASDRSLRKYVGLIVMTLAPFMANIHHLFVESNMPSKVVTMWQALFFIGLYVYMKTKNPVILLAGTLLIAMTQPMMAAVGVAFIGLFCAVLLAFRSISFKQLVMFAVVVVILVGPVLLELSSHSFLKSDPAAWNAGDGSYGVLNLHHIGHYLIQKPQLTFPLPDLLFYTIAALSLISARGLKNRWLQMSLLLTLLALTLRFYNQNLTIFVGLICLLVTVKDRFLKLAILLSSLLYPLIVYNPLLTTRLSSDLPPWFLERIQSWDIFGIVGIFAALYYAFIRQAAQWKFARNHWMIYVSLSAFIVLVTVASSGGLGPDPYANIPSQKYETRSIFQPFVPFLNQQVVLVADTRYASPSYVPVVANAYLVGGLSAAQADPTANIVRRDQCVDEIVKSLSPVDIRAAKVTSIIVNTSEYPDLLHQLESSQYFTYKASDERWELFQLSRSPSVNYSHNTVCEIPYGQ